MHLELPNFVLLDKILLVNLWNDAKRRIDFRIFVVENANLEKRSHWSDENSYFVHPFYLPFLNDMPKAIFRKSTLALMKIPNLMREIQCFLMFNRCDSRERRDGWRFERVVPDWGQPGADGGQISRRGSKRNDRGGWIQET